MKFFFLSSLFLMSGVISISSMDRESERPDIQSSGYEFTQRCLYNLNKNLAILYPEICSFKVLTGSLSDFYSSVISF